MELISVSFCTSSVDAEADDEVGGCLLGGVGAQVRTRSALEGSVLLLLQVGKLRLEWTNRSPLGKESHTPASQEPTRAGERKGRAEKEEYTNACIHSYGPSSQPHGPTLCWPGNPARGSQHSWEGSRQPLLSRCCFLLSFGGQVPDT